MADVPTAADPPKELGPYTPKMAGENLLLEYRTVPLQKVFPHHPGVVEDQAAILGVPLPGSEKVFKHNPYRPWHGPRLASHARMSLSIFPFHEPTKKGAERMKAKTVFPKRPKNRPPIALAPTVFRSPEVVKATPIGAAPIELQTLRGQTTTKLKKMLGDIEEDDE